MDADKWNKVIKFLNTTKADPEKVLKSLKVIYGKTSNKNSWYQIWRGSWPIEVVVAIYNKEGMGYSNCQRISDVRESRYFISHFSDLLIKNNIYIGEV